MNLIKLGDMILNVERICGIQDHLPAGDPSATGQQTIIRVLFDNSHIDLSGAAAKIFRRWYRHVARDISPHKDEDGEELVSPEVQLRKACDVLLSQIDQVRPRDGALRTAARQLSGIIDLYMTGELEPMRISQFNRHYASASHTVPDFPEHPSS